MFKKGGRTSQGCSAPAPAASSRNSASAASSWYPSPASPVRQNDPRRSAPIKQDRPLTPGQQAQATEAAQIQKAVGAREETKKAEAARHHAEYLAFKEGGGPSSGCSAHAPATSGWDSTPAASG